MRGIKILQQDFALKMQGGGLMREGGDVFAGHQGIYILVTRPSVFALMF